MRISKLPALAAVLSAGMAGAPLITMAQVGNAGTSGESTTATPGVTNGQTDASGQPSSTRGPSAAGRTSQSGLQPSTQPTREPQTTGSTRGAQRNHTSAERKTDDQHK